MKCSVRTVSSNFGFAFESISAPSSQDATATREFDEPPAKRRKTMLSSEVVVIESTVTKSVDVSKSKKTAKTRRKLDLENDDLDQANAVEEDSFIAVLGKKRTTVAETQPNKMPATKRIATATGKAKEVAATSSKAVVDIHETQAATVSRPRRRAAASGASRVAEGLEAETMANEKKRQVIEESKKRGRSRKKDVVVEQETGCGSAEVVVPVDSSEAAPKKRAIGRKRKAKDEDAVLEQVADVAVEEQTLVDSEAQVKVAPNRTRGTVRELKVRDEEFAPEQTVNLAVDQDRDKLAEGVALRQADDTATHKDMRSQKSASRNAPKATKDQPPRKRTRQNVTEVAPCTESCADSPADVAGDGDPNDTRRKVSSRSTKTMRTQRQPLAETNMNITMRSASPEKLPREVSKASTFQEPESNAKKRTRTPASHQPLPRPEKPDSRRRKLTIKCDAVENTSQGDSKQTSLDPTPTTAASAADHASGAPTAVKRRRNLMHDAMEDAGAGIVSSCESLTAIAPVVNEPNVRNFHQGEKADRCESSGAGDEDVDWLFAPQPQSSFPKSTTSKVTRGSAVKKRKFKMPEMDLDDLLSNIATFAQEKTMPGAVVAKDMKLFAGSEKKPRGVGRKKAKV